MKLNQNAKFTYTDCKSAKAGALGKMGSATNHLNVSNPMKVIAPIAGSNHHGFDQWVLEGIPLSSVRTTMIHFKQETTFRRGHKKCMGLLFKQTKNNTNSPA